MRLGRGWDAADGMWLGCGLAVVAGPGTGVCRNMEPVTPVPTACPPAWLGSCSARLCSGSSAWGNSRRANIWRRETKKKPMLSGAIALLLTSADPANTATHTSNTSSTLPPAIKPTESQCRWQRHQSCWVQSEAGEGVGACALQHQPVPGPAASLSGPGVGQDAPPSQARRRANQEEQQGSHRPTVARPTCSSGQFALRGSTFWGRRGKRCPRGGGATVPRDRCRRGFGLVLVCGRARRARGQK